MNLEQKIEAILFYKNEPVAIKDLAKILSEKEDDINRTIENLSKNLENRGICLVSNKKEVSLATVPGMNEIIEKIAKDEMSKDIGKAGLETLAIVLYNGPISRREVDYIRGVNSAFILRNLCIRGLIEKETDQKDQRVFRYKSSLQLLAYLGIRQIEELPDFESFKKVMSQLDKTENKNE